MIDAAASCGEGTSVASLDAVRRFAARERTFSAADRVVALGSAFSSTGSVFLRVRVAFFSAPWAALLVVARRLGFLGGSTFSLSWLVDAFAFAARVPLASLAGGDFRVRVVLGLVVAFVCVAGVGSSASTAFLTTRLVLTAAALASSGAISLLALALALRVVRAFLTGLGALSSFAVVELVVLEAALVVLLALSFSPSTAFFVPLFVRVVLLPFSAVAFWVVLALAFALVAFFDGLLLASARASL